MVNHFLCNKRKHRSWHLTVDRGLDFSIATELNLCVYPILTEQSQFFTTSFDRYTFESF